MCAVVGRSARAVTLSSAVLDQRWSWRAHSWVHALKSSPPCAAGQKLRPDFALSFEFGTHSSARGDGSAVFVGGGHGGGSFDVQQRFKVAKGMALEVGWVLHGMLCAALPRLHATGRAV